MKLLKSLGFTAIAAAVLAIPVTQHAAAQVSINIGTAPSCPYGYYEAPPYRCAPDGYYGPEWFSSGVFVGSGPWYHGPEHFYGHVDHHYDYRHGYKGHFPEHNEHVAEHRAEFHGNAMHDVHGHEAPRGHK